MRKPTPLQWIEEREAREIIAAALFELPPPPFAPAAGTGWAARLRRRVLARPPAHAQAARHQPSLQGMPAYVASRAVRSDTRSRRRKLWMISRAASIWPPPSPDSGISARNLASMSAQAMPSIPAPLGA